MSYKTFSPSTKRRPNFKKRPHRINEEIVASKIRFIDEDKKYVGIVTVEEALEVARQKEYDLVEVSPNANPPVCKLLDYGKFLYSLQKKEHEAKKHQKKIQIKEIKFTPAIQDHDIQVKLKKIEKFLEAGIKVKITIWLRGKQKRKPEMLKTMTEKIVQILENVGKIESPPKVQGFMCQFIITQKKGGHDAKTENT